MRRQATSLVAVISTGDARLDKSIKGLSEAKCWQLVRELERRAALIRNTLKTHAAKRAKAAPVMEWNGDDIIGNSWIKIGLPSNQVKQLTNMGKRWGIRRSPCAAMARHLVSLALVNAKETETRLAALLKYIEAEGFNTIGNFCWRNERN